jgi:ankyrin repeat protein
VLKTRFFDVNTHDPDGATPLSMAVDSENKAIVNQLLAAGVDIDGVYNDFGNLLQVASVEGSIRRVQLLLQCGADVNAHGRYYGQALQAAAAKGHLSVVRLLLERGADVNAKGGKYGTALKAALLAGHANVVKVLQDHGARRTYHNPWEDYYGTRLPVVLKSDIPELESKLRPQNA